MVLILAVWAVLSIIFTGFGLLILRFFKIKSAQGNSADFFWIGWAFTIFLLQIWHLVFRIDYKAFLLVSAIGLAGIVWNRSEIRLRLFNNKKIVQNAVLCFFLVIFALLIANHAAFRPTNEDSAIYHLSSVRWAESYPIVPGLGNLHVHLAYNSSYFLYAALLEIVKFRSYHFANGILLLALCAQIFPAIGRLIKNNGKIKISDVYTSLFFYIAVNYIADYNISSPSPDLPIFILGVLISIQWLILLENSKDDSDEIEYRLFYITVLAVAGIAVKLSFLAMGICTLLPAFAVWLIRGRRWGGVPHMAVIKRTVQCMIIGLVPWMFRSVIVSGYLIYPSTLIAFPVEWRISPAAVYNDWNWIRTWSHIPFVSGSPVIWSPTVLKSWSWFCRWASSMVSLRLDELIPPFISASIGFFTIVICRLKNRLTINKSNMALFFLPPVFSMIYWFYMAPALRFAGAVFYILGFGMLAFAIGGVSDLFKKRTVRRAAISFIIFCAVSSQIFKPISFAIDWIPPGEDIFGLHSTPLAKMKKFETRSGLAYYVPVKGDKCWDAPLPCTPYPNANLRLRRKDDMRHGFVIDGA